MMYLCIHSTTLVYIVQPDDRNDYRDEIASEDRAYGGLSVYLALTSPSDSGPVQHDTVWLTGHVLCLLLRPSASLAS